MTAEQELREVIARAIFGEPGEFDWRSPSWSVLSDQQKAPFFAKADRVLEAYDAFWAELT